MIGLSLGDILGSALASARPTPPLVRAGRGEHSALRELADSSLDLAQGLEGAQRLVLLVEALTFFRLAAAHDAPEDVRKAVVVLGDIAATMRDMGEADAGDRYEGQGVLLAEMAAEAGDAELADLIVHAASLITPGAFSEATR